MFFLLFGTIPAFKAIIKNRFDLKGFSLFNIGILIGQSLYTVYFAALGDYFTVVLSIPLVIYWVLVLTFLIRMRLKR
jgi:hypothetical protein